MRVLVTSTPGVGHVLPLAPLARSMRERGHDVLWAVAPEGQSLVRRLGFRTTPVGLNVAERSATLAPELPSIMARPEKERRGYLYAGFFARGAAPQAARDLEPVFDTYRPNIVLSELGELGAAPLAVQRNIAHATVAFSGALSSDAVALLLAAIEPLWTSRGLPTPNYSDIVGAHYFHPFPAMMGHRGSITQLRFLQPHDSVLDVDQEMPSWVHALGETRPAVYVTAGTTPIGARLAPWTQQLEALGALDVDVVATIPREVESTSQAVPPNVRIEHFIPQRWILPRVSVVVSQVGAGTMLGAAAAGVPQLAIPSWADQWDNADALVRTGSAIQLDPSHHDAASIQAAVTTLQTDNDYATSAQSLAAAIREMPTADQTAEFLDASH